MTLLSPRALLRRQVYMPWARIPQGRMVELGDRGSTYVTDTPGPRADSPTVVLLHAVGCTGLLTWYPALEPLSRRFRVVTMDQRWHGRGIQSEEFSLRDCADDVAALVDTLDLGRVVVAGYSMGSIIAQRVWRQHPEITAGLVLCATTDRFRSSPAERVFHEGMELAMLGSRGLSRSRTAVAAARATARALDLEPSDIHDWAMAEFR
ncbi:MAG: alpha/beta fold hydrolase, partial [Nocardioides sp.]